jgi:hypothetical protein
MKEIDQIVRDIERVRSCGKFPPTSASARRAFEKRYNYDKTLLVGQKTIDITLACSCSCHYVRYSVDVLVDGKRVAHYMTYLKLLASLVA